MTLKRIDTTGRFRVVDDEGNFYLVLKFVHIMSRPTKADPEGEEVGLKRYMLMDRTPVNRLGATEFEIAGTGRRLRLVADLENEGGK
jgi:hypothetical protein